jgi:hypothetical protein
MLNSEIIGLAAGVDFKKPFRTKFIDKTYLGHIYFCNFGLSWL